MIFEGNHKITAWLVEVIAALTPPCHDVTRLLSQSLDRSLPWSMRARLQLHNTICIWCERYGRQLRLIREVSRAIPPRGSAFTCEKLPPESRARVRALLQTETSLS